MTNVHEAYERLVGLVGTRSTRTLGVVQATQFQRFAYAVGDLDERYFRGSSGGPPQAPALFLSAVMGWEAGPDEADLRADGTDPASTAGLPLDGLRLMGAGQDLTFHRPVNDGDRIDRIDRIETVEFKQGRSGELVVLTVKRDYQATGGEPVLTCLETFVAR